MVSRSSTTSSTETSAKDERTTRLSLKQLFAPARSSNSLTTASPYATGANIQDGANDTELEKKALQLTDPERHPVEAKLQNAAARFFSSTSVVPSDLPTLPRPVAIPRLHPGSTFPFARAWVPELANHAIQQEEWLAFVDRLNLISFPHPTVTLMELAAVGVSFVPIDAADGISALVDLLAMLTATAIVKARCKHFLNRANETYFHPRKLHASITSTPSLKAVLGLAKDDKLIAPLEEKVLEVSAQDRCLAQLKQYTCDLDFDVPDQAVDTLYLKTLSKASRWRANYKVRKRDKNARFMRRRSWKKMQKGKQVKNEGWSESMNIRWISWLLVQSLDEYEAQQKMLVQEKQRKRDAAKQRRASLISLSLRMSKTVGDSKKADSIMDESRQ